METYFVTKKVVAKNIAEAIKKDGELINVEKQPQREGVSAIGFVQITEEEYE